MAQMITDSKAGAALFNAKLPSLLAFLSDDERAAMSYTYEDMIVDATYEGKKLNIRSASSLVAEED